MMGIEQGMKSITLRAFIICKRLLLSARNMMLSSYCIIN